MITLRVTSKKKATGCNQLLATPPKSAAHGSWKSLEPGTSPSKPTRIKCHTLTDRNLNCPVMTGRFRFSDFLNCPTGNYAVNLTKRSLLQSREYIILIRALLPLPAPRSMLHAPCFIVASLAAPAQQCASLFARISSSGTVLYYHMKRRINARTRGRGRGRRRRRRTETYRSQCLTTPALPPWATKRCSLTTSLLQNHAALSRTIR